MEEKIINKESANDMVSIIVPVYNAEKTLDRCINSILNQKYREFELILVNDGSTDNSLDIIKNYQIKDKRIKIIDSINRGVSEARNSGLNKANGKYIQFIDSDDYIEADMLENTVSKLDNKEADLIISGINIKVEKNEKIISSVQTFNYEEVEGKSNIAKSVLERLDGTYINAVWNKLFRRDIIVENKILLPKDISLGEDLIFTLEYLKHCNKVIFDNESYYNYCINTCDNLSYRYREDKLDLMYLLYIKSKNYLLSSGLDEEEILELNSIFIKSIYSALNDFNHSKCRLSLKEKLALIKETRNTYGYIISNTVNLELLIKVLRLGLNIPLLGLVLNKGIFIIKTRYTEKLYE